MAFVSVDATGNSPGLDAADSDFGVDSTNTTVDRIGSPENLTKLGVRTTNRLSELDQSPGGHRLVVCFDSITELLQYVEVDQAFRFFHVVTDRLAELDAVAHFHMDPAAHDDETIETIAALFDGVMTAGEDGSFD